MATVRAVGQSRRKSPVGTFARSELRAKGLGWFIEFATWSRPPSRELTRSLQVGYAHSSLGLGGTRFANKRLEVDVHDRDQRRCPPGLSRSAAKARIHSRRTVPQHLPRWMDRPEQERPQRPLRRPRRSDRATHRRSPRTHDGAGKNGTNGDALRLPARAE